MALFVFCSFIMEYLNGTLLRRESNKIQLYENKVCPSLLLFLKKETARLLKALAEFSCFIFLMNWKKIEENSGKKALQQEL